MDYFETTLPEPFNILGQQLKPLSLGHLIILHRLEAVPVEDNDTLFLAVMVCSTDATTLEDLFNDRWLNFKLWYWQWRLGEVDWLKAHELWSEYFKLHMSQPSYRSKHDNNNSNPSGTPFLQSLKATLQAKLNYSPKEALRCPMQTALWDWLSFHELEGNVEVLDVDWREAMKAKADEEHEELVKRFKEGTLNDGN